VPDPFPHSRSIEAACRLTSLGTALPVPTNVCRRAIRSIVIVVALSRSIEQESVQARLLLLRARPTYQPTNCHRLSVDIEAGVMSAPGLRRWWVR
jgi:hypothetical protein